MTILNKFNFSYSTHDTWLKSPLQFYFAKIANAPESDEGIQVYGDAGNAVHKAGEDWFNNKTDTFAEYWDSYEIDKQRGIKGHKLDFFKFHQMYLDLVKYMKDIKGDAAKTELKIEMVAYGMNMQGFIDLYTLDGEDIIIYDWKTNSTHDFETHRKQRLLYSWFIWKKKEIIPICRWVYLKNMDVVEERISLDELIKFEAEIVKFIDEIKEKGEDISNYDAGNWKNPFNKYYSLCRAEVESRQSSKYLEVYMSIRGNFIFFEGDVNPKLLEGIDFKTRFNLPNKRFMQEAVKKKAKGRINLSEVGTVHLYNRQMKCFPIGMFEQVKNICNEFAEYYNKEMKIFISDNRDKHVMNLTAGKMPEKLNTELILRPYQNEAIKIFMEKEVGVFHIATRGGKTITAAEIIRKIDGKCLWIIDRITLLKQTKKTLQDLLGIKVGEISGDMIDIDGCPLIIASIQSLYSKVDELIPFFAGINFVVVDEFHKAAARSYQVVFAKLPNTRYRLGLTATPKRTDGFEPVLFSIIGNVIYNVSPRQLIDLGYLIEPTIEFHEVQAMTFDTDYQTDYNNNIVFNGDRNKKIIKIVEQHKNKKIMILTKLVLHGKMLQEMIPGSQHCHGSSKDSAKIYKAFVNNEFKHLVMTISKGGEGLDIPDLDMTINAAANKGDIATEQLGGRSLTINDGKTEAHIIDFLDQGHHTRKHSHQRIMAYEQLGFKVKII